MKARRASSGFFNGSISVFINVWNFVRTKVSFLSFSFGNEDKKRKTREKGRDTCHMVGHSKHHRCKEPFQKLVVIVSIFSRIKITCLLIIICFYIYIFMVFFFLKQNLEAIHFRGVI